MGVLRTRKPPEASVIQVIRVVVAEGEGVELSPIRLVTYYYSLDGEVLARHDQFEDNRTQATEGEWPEGR